MIVERMPLQAEALLIHNNPGEIEEFLGCKAEQYGGAWFLRWTDLPVKYAPMGSWALKHTVTGAISFKSDDELKNEYREVK
jgi:hypothetical protein